MSGVRDTVWGVDADCQRFPAACGRLYKEESQHELTAYCLRLTAVPMLRKTLTILSLIGLLLSLGLLCLSCWNTVYVPRTHGPRFDLVRGALCIGILHLSPPSEPCDWHDQVQAGQERYTVSWHTIKPGFHIGRYVGPFRSGPSKLIEKWIWLPKYRDGWTTSAAGTDGKRVTIKVREHVVIVPLWIPTFGFVTALWFSIPLSHYGRRRKRKKLGLCVRCGYDLRASEDRCPECGTGFSNQGTTRFP